MLTRGVTQQGTACLAGPQRASSGDLKAGTKVFVNPRTGREGYVHPHPAEELLSWSDGSTLATDGAEAGEGPKLLGYPLRDVRFRQQNAEVRAHTQPS